MLKPRGTNAGANVETVFLHPSRSRPPVLESQTQPATNTTGTVIIASRYRTLEITCIDATPKVACKDRSHACTGNSIPLALQNAANTNRKINTATSKRRKSLFRWFPFRAIWTSCVPGVEASNETFSCGQAWTQSRQKVQSMLLVLRGWKSCNSHPRCWSLPRMQSCVLQVPQTERLRTVT